jgi:hypothetical protein
MTVDTYILDEKGDAVHEPALERCYAWFERPENRLVKRDELPNSVSVSTVFLGPDHNFVGRGPPVLWETMIVGGKHDGYQERYTGRAAALKGHAVAVALVKRRDRE